MPEAVEARSRALAGQGKMGPLLVRLRTAGFESAALALFALWSLVPLGILFVRVRDGLAFGTGDRVFLGVDGPDVADQLQYMSWIPDAGDHILFANRFDLVTDPHLFLHPMFALSGLAWKLGASVQVAFLAWKPIAVAVLFAGFAAYVRRMVEPGGWARPATLALAWFFFTPAAWLLEWLGLGSSSLRFGLLVMAVEMFPGAFVWGLWPLAVAVGLMPVYLLCLERALEPCRRRAGRSGGFYVAGASAAGLITAWLHPWQGLVLLGITGGLTVWARLWRPRVLAAPILATAAPLAYYYVLTKTHSSWAVAGHAGNPHLGGWFFLALAPPLALAILGLRSDELDLQERAIRLWPLVAVSVYFALDTSWFYHAFAGVSLPLAILAVRGWRRLRGPVTLGAALAAVFTLPGMAFYVQKLRESANDHFLAPGEVAAMRFAQRAPRVGGILTSDDLGRAVPAFAGRSTWVGHFTWTPNHVERVVEAQQLFDGRLAPVKAQAFVRSTGAAFLLSGCGRPDIGPALGHLISGRHQFGCAVLYEVARGHRSDRTVSA